MPFKMSVTFILVWFHVLRLKCLIMIHFDIIKHYTIFNPLGWMIDSDEARWCLALRLGMEEETLHCY